MQFNSKIYGRKLLAYLRYILVKAESTVINTPILKSVSDGVILIPSNLVVDNLVSFLYQS